MWLVGGCSSVSQWNSFSLSRVKTSVRPGIVVEQDHVSDWLTAPFGLVCGFHVVQKRAVIRSIHSTTFVKEVDEH